MINNLSVCVDFEYRVVPLFLETKKLIDENILDFSILITNHEMQWLQSWPVGYIIDNTSSQSSSIGLTTRSDIEAYQNLTSNKSKNDRRIKISCFCSPH